MDKIKNALLKHPLLSILLILPFSLLVVFAVLDLIINIVVPFVFAVWLAGWIYGFLVGESMRRSVYEPFWFIQSKRF